MPDFDLDAALVAPPPFSVERVSFSSAAPFYYIKFTPEDGSAPFNATWFKRRQDAVRACHAANRKHAVRPYPYQRQHGGVVLKLPPFDQWLRS